MGIFRRKKQNSSPASAAQSPGNPSARPAAELRADPNLIQVFDEFGREAFVSREEWRTKVLPGTIKTNWDKPEELYNIIAGSLRDGFRSEVLKAAEHLWQIDPSHARSACVYAVVLMGESRLQEAEHVLKSYIEKNGDEGYVLANLAKVYSARKERERAESTLWHALEVDPNQNNALTWYVSIHKERGGEGALRESLLRVTSLPESWRSQLWLARAALESHDLEQAVTFYRDVLSRCGEQVPTDVLMQMSGDLGRSGHIEELLQLAEPHFRPEVHGLAVGNNLIKAHLDRKEFALAQNVLDQLYGLKRPDYKQHLNFWDAEIAKARVAAVARPATAQLQAEIAVVEGPVWLKPSSPARALFAEKTAESPVVGFLGSTAELSSGADEVQLQMSDAPGRMTRALPLFLAEQVELASTARAQVMVPCVMGSSSGFVLSGVPWTDEDAARYSTEPPAKSDYLVVIHLKTKLEPWLADLRLIRVSDRACLERIEASFPAAKPQEGIPRLAKELLKLLTGKPGIQTLPPPAAYQPVVDTRFPAYLLRLEQLLAVRFAAMEGFPSSFLNGEREILEGNLQLCLESPENVTTRILLAQTFLAMSEVRPEVTGDFRDKVALLQEKKPLPGRAQSIVRDMLAPILAG